MNTLEYIFKTPKIQRLMRMSTQPELLDKLQLLQVFWNE